MTKMLWDNPQALEAITFLTDFNVRHKTMDIGGFETGKLAMIHYHTVLMGDLKKYPKVKYQVSPVPAPDGQPETTIGTQWAWKPNDKLKTLQECIQTLIKTASGNGNLLFNVGPMMDGRIEH